MTQAPPIFFPSGSRLGEVRCGIAIILDDDIAEPTEDFSVNVVSQDEDVAVVVDSVLTVFIEDDDGMMTRSLGLYMFCQFCALLYTVITDKVGLDKRTV